MKKCFIFLFFYFSLINNSLGENIILTCNWDNDPQLKFVFHIDPEKNQLVQFNNQNPEEFEYSSKINDVISSNLKNTSLFKILPEESFLQSKNEVFLQPTFADWRLIDANFLVSGIISYADNNLSINF